MENLENLTDVDILSKVLLDEYHRYDEAEGEDRKAILDRIERLERIINQRNKDILEMNRCELECDKLEENKRQFDENQQREIERCEDDKKFKEQDIEAKKKRDKTDIIMDCIKIGVPVAVAIGEGIFIYHMQTKTMVFERDGNIWGRSAASKLAQNSLNNYARKIS